MEQYKPGSVMEEHYLTNQQLAKSERKLKQPEEDSKWRALKKGSGCEYCQDLCEMTAPCAPARLAYKEPDGMWRTGMLAHAAGLIAQSTIGRQSR
jgi:hypothetical protein